MKQKGIKIDYSKWAREKFNITDLSLDPNNIRLQIDVESPQDAIINDLFVNENAMQILESIVNSGLFPDELIVVVKENTKTFVIEGNRRVAALKALIHPDLVPTNATKIKGIKKNISIIRKIEAVVAPDRNSASLFLANKHTQNTKRPWRPLRQAFFYQAELNRGKTIDELRRDYQNVDIEGFLRLINIYKIAKSIQYDSEETIRKVFNERTFPASTIERLYSDKQVRDFLGFDFIENGDIKINIKKSEFQKGFKRIIQDVVDKVIDSRKLNSDKNRLEYLKSFKKDEIPNKTKANKSSTSKDFQSQPQPKIKKRTKLAPQDINFTLQAPGLRRMLIELQQINYRKFPNATHDLVRSFLECALKAYFSHKNITVPHRGRFVMLDDVLQQFLKEMKKLGNRELEQVTQRVLSNDKMKGYTANFLNAINHNPSIFAIEQDVEDAWDTLEKIFRYILEGK